MSKRRSSERQRKGSILHKFKKKEKEKHRVANKSSEEEEEEVKSIGNALRNCEDVKLIFIMGHVALVSLRGRILGMDWEMDWDQITVIILHLRG